MTIGTFGSLLTINEAKAVLRVSTGTVYNLLAAGELQRVKIRGRTLVRSQDLLDLIERSVLVCADPTFPEPPDAQT